MFKEYKLGKNYHLRSDKGQGSIVQRLEKEFSNLNKDGSRGLKTEPEGFLRFKLDLLYDLVEGEHTWTIRYKPNVIRWPYNDTLPLEPNRLSVLFQWESTEKWKEIGDLTIPRMAVGHVKDWPKDHESIFGSGWKSKRHMVKGISDIYEPIYGNRLTPDDVLVAYALEGFFFKPEYVDRWKQAKREAGL